MKHRTFRVRMLWAAVALSLAGPFSQALAQNPNPGVLPVNSSPHGNSYAEWSALWWRWFISLPVSDNPAFGADCGNGQVGGVWFLAAVGGQPATVSCTVPPGKMLFLPIINTECSNLESPPFYGATASDRRTCARSITDGAAGLAATIDGTPVNQPEAYRVTSPNFTFVAPVNNVLGVAAGNGESVGDGFYLMLAPLSSGAHTIRVEASFPAFAFSIDTTFNITVSH